jgi:hypothetical protein
LGTNYNLNSVYFITNEIGFTSDATHIFKSEDGGLTWDLKYNNANQAFRKFYFINSDTGFVLGDNNVIFKTTDLGESWLEKNIDTINTTYPIGITFRNDNTGWLALNTTSSWAGYIYKTFDCGETWNKIYSIPSSEIDVLVDLIGFSNSDTLYFSYGYFNVFMTYGVRKSIDGGINWNQTSLPYSHLFFISPDTGWAADRVGWHSFSTMIARTNDGGQSYNVEYSDLYGSGIRSLFFVNNNYGWAVGTYGYVLKYFDFTGVNDTLLLPIRYKLFQNYPNPFNPTTTISFSIPQSQNVELKVFDLLGNEVANIVDEEKPVGRYEVKFNAENLSSGIYYYRLKAGGFVQTKKLILMK